MYNFTLTFKVGHTASPCITDHRFLSIGSLVQKSEYKGQALFLATHAQLPMKSKRAVFIHIVVEFGPTYLNIELEKIASQD